MVRLKYAKLLTVLVLAVNVILIFYTWKWFLSGDTSTNPSKTDAKAAHAAGHRQKDRAHTTIKHIKKTITIIFRDFYHFENDLHHSIDSILNLIPNIQIFVIYDAEPYPPLIFINNYTVTHPNVKFINLNFDIRKTAKALMPILQIRTKYALFVPDSFRFGGRAIIQKMLGEMEKKPSNKKDERTASIALDTKAHDSTASGDKVVQGQQANHPSDDSTDTITNTDKTKSIANKTAIKTIIIIPFASNVKTMSNCCRINIDIANWTMEYIVKNDTHHCDMVNFNQIKSKRIERDFAETQTFFFFSFSFSVSTKACNPCRCKPIENHAKCAGRTIPGNVLCTSKNGQSQSK